MVGSIRHVHQSAEAQPILAEFDASIAAIVQSIDVDQTLWPHYLELHEVDERGASGKIRDRRGAWASGGLRRSCPIADALIGEGVHG
jgi:hypothetical protein